MSTEDRVAEALRIAAERLQNRGKVARDAELKKLAGVATFGKEGVCILNACNEFNYGADPSEVIALVLDLTPDERTSQSSLIQKITDSLIENPVFCVAMLGELATTDASTLKETLGELSVMDLHELASRAQITVDRLGNLSAKDAIFYHAKIAATTSDEGYDLVAKSELPLRERVGALLAAPRSLNLICASLNVDPATVAIQRVDRVGTSYEVTVRFPDIQISDADLTSLAISSMDQLSNLSGLPVTVSRTTHIGQDSDVVFVVARKLSGLTALSYTEDRDLSSKARTLLATAYDPDRED